MSRESSRKPNAPPPVPSTGPRHRPAALAVAGCALSWAACATYSPAELDPDTLLRALVAEREREPDGPTATLAEAAEHMQRHNLRIVEARAATAEARARAQHPTPLANPTLSAGPLLLDGPGILSSARWGVEAALGWAVPLSGRRGIVDDLDDALAHAATVHAAGIARREYLALRRDYAVATLRAASLRAHQDRARAAEVLAERQRQLVAVDRGSALDVRATELELSQAQDAVLEERSNLVDARGALAQRTGLAARAFSALPREQTAPRPDEIPALEGLRALLPESPALAAVAASYLVAEQELRLQIARQWPDLEIGGSFEREEKVHRYGLPLGISIPLFDRNQEGIAAARARRHELRSLFEATLRSALSRLEVAHARVVARTDRLRHLETTALPGARTLVQSARNSVRAGRLDHVEFLRLVRIESEIVIEALRAERDVYDAWGELEQACGGPLLRFPGEPTPDGPTRQQDERPGKGPKEQTR